MSVPSIAFINSNNQLEITLGTKMTANNYLALIKKVYDLGLEIEDMDLPVKVLVDCSNQEEMEETAEEFAVKGTRDLQFAKIASFKLNPKFIPVLAKIMKEVEPSSVRNFDTREEAEEWLSGI